MLAFVAEHGAVVHKAMVAPPHRFIDTRLWSDEDRAYLHDLVLCATVFQEYVAGPCDLRLTVIGREIFAARIETDGGEHVFFEIKPEGQFLYIEILTGMSITAAVAARLAG